MLRLTVCFLITAFLFVVVLTPRAEPFATLTRVTNTPEHVLNLNPTLSDDGRTVVFESTADLAGTEVNSSFHALRVDLAREAFAELGRTRAVCPAVSGDGKIVVFASNEDLIGRNADRNSEIFLFDGSGLKQLTETQPATSVSRMSDGNFQPSITSDGRVIAFSSNREIFLYDSWEEKYTQLTNKNGAVNPKISADGSRVYYKRPATTDLADLVLIETASLTTRVLAANVSGLSLTEGRAVSNDGMRLVYSALTASNQSQVFMFDGRDNSVRQLTQLGSRAVDVALQPTISGDGRRVAFATRRRVLNSSDGGVELYLLDLPSGQMQQITNATSTATAEVISSLNFDGSLVAFSFPRILSGPVSDDDLRNNSEIYLASIPPRAIGTATVVNAAARGNEPQPSNIAPGSIAHIRGSKLALKTEGASLTEPPFAVAGTTISVNNQLARIFYVSPDEVVFVVPNGLASGPAQFLVTNSEGLSSMAEALISPTAPGLFTLSGDGRGEAMVLNSDTLVRGPFDPSSGSLRLSIFATGVKNANSVAVTINGRPVVIETVAPARLIGFDEIHILVPAELQGAGTSTLIVIADGVQSNSVSIVVGGTSPTPTPTPPPSPTATPTPEASPHIVISQIFGGGGNAGAPFRNDFIEIFNAGNSPVNLTGWSVQYASATASTWSVTPLTPVTLAPGQYYLVQESSGGSNGTTLTAPDASGTIAMAAGSGKVVLFKGSTTLTGTCPSDPNIVDLLGYGNTANCFRGSGPAIAPSNTNALLRAAAGCTDAQNNATDFILGPPNPRNTNFLQRICTDP
ncbi:MAG TPA: lamin tail domain-containing protein [Pyrinomonadaceae bacterium]|nr:lamin tail domain-containing protein [Pyrinomonadaceae bacterium]